MIATTDSLKDMKKKIYEYQISTRGYKYKLFPLLVRIFKYISLSPTRGTLLEEHYALMRYLDDVVDGDAPLPKNANSVAEYLKQKIDFVGNPQNPKDAIDHWLLYCFKLADKIGHNITSEVKDILSSLFFDAKRSGKLIIYPEKELQYHFNLLDIRGVVKGTLKIFGENPDKYLALEPLGTVSRIYYDLRDLQEDLVAGYINISKEDIEKNNISHSDLEDVIKKSSSYKERSIKYNKKRNNLEKEFILSCPRGIQDWYIQRSELGMKLLEQHKKNLSKEQFKLLTKLAFLVGYEISARRYFKKILNMLNNEYVILVDKNDKEIGIEEKIKAHEEGKLHRAFSIFIYNNDNKKLLITKRALSKYHSGGLWSNACCSHPKPNESLEESVHRRLQEEMGFDCDLKKAGYFIYKDKVGNGLVENEFDYIFTGISDVREPKFNKSEVAEIKWMKVDELKKDILQNPQNYTPWFKIALNYLEK